MTSTPPDTPPRVLFIGGIGRSGTTVLERSLGTDARVVSLGEVTHLWKRSLLGNELCGCGLQFRACDFWQQVGDAAFGGWSQIDARRVIELKETLDKSWRTPGIALGVGTARWRADLDEYGGYYHRLYRAALEVSGARVAIDSSKQASLPHILLRQPVDLTVLHCVRDSRAVAYSWMQKVARPEARDDESKFMTQYSPPTLATKWTIHNGVIEALRLRRARLMRLRYEDWVADPGRYVRDVMDFAGLPDTDRSDRLGPTWVELDEAHTCSGNPMRFTVGRVEIRHDQRWRHGMSRRDRAVVTALTLPFLLRYRYLR